MSDPSNPYGGPDDGSGGPPSWESPGVPPTHTPYGQPASPAYGAPAYGGPAYGGPAYGQGPAQKTDGLSIAALVLSLTCCLSFVGAILGFVGLSRTKPGSGRSGRWAAVTAIVAGIVLTLASAAIVVFVVVVGESLVSPDEAERGMCVDVEEEDDDEVLMTEAECGEPHDAEVVHVDEVAATDVDLSRPADLRQLCTVLMPGDDVALLDPALEWQVLLEDPADPQPEDVFVCYVQPRGGDRLDQRLLD